MIVPPRMQVHFGNNLYLEGQTIPKDAEGILTAAMGSVPAPQKAQTSQTQASPQSTAQAAAN